MKSKTLFFEVALAVFFLDSPGISCCSPVMVAFLTSGCVLVGCVEAPPVLSCWCELSVRQDWGFLISRPGSFFGSAVL